MELKSIKISNYRSIKEISFDVVSLGDSTFTYGLIGVNEAGKSTILKALALKDGLKDEKGNPLPLQKDFKDKSKPIEIEYLYTLDKDTKNQCRESLKTQPTPIEVEETDLKDAALTVVFNFANLKQPELRLNLVNIPDDRENKVAAQDLIKKIILDKAHKAIFWTAEDRYLISQPINLSKFSENPDAISIPLKNCFALAGITGRDNIKNRILLITESTERELLKDDLGKKVTAHINAAWPKHKIKITFDISDGLINFHVHDLGAKGRAKTADQRSDGFRQFISFLLTVSAQSKNDELTNSILLLDEPETHLHPQAQEDLLKELIKITNNKRNNVVFFATHSNYMIDKNDLSRNFKIKKEKDDNTEKEQFDKKNSTYASVTYEVFDIASTDYHNELYSRLHQRYQDADTADDKREKIKNFDEKFLHTEKKLKKDKTWKGTPNDATLPTYIRNCIHHSDNGDTYKDDDLRKSIDLLIFYL